MFNVPEAMLKVVEFPFIIEVLVAEIVGALALVQTVIALLPHKPLVEQPPSPRA